MSKTILVTGGARSGKSAIAESLALDLRDPQGGPVIYIATAQAFDREMQARIAAHQDRRGDDWLTIEEPLDLPDRLQNLPSGGPVLVDCLTLWLSNLMLAERDWNAAAKALVAALADCAGPVVLVTNEVGAGIVPENALARAFRDAAGSLNQQIAAQADDVIMAVCGLPVKVK